MAAILIDRSVGGCHGICTTGAECRIRIGFERVGKVGLVGCHSGAPERDAF